MNFGHLFFENIYVDLVVLLQSMATLAMALLSPFSKFRYRPFHKTLPRSSAFVNQKSFKVFTSVRKIHSVLLDVYQYLLYLSTKKVNTKLIKKHKQQLEKFIKYSISHEDYILCSFNVPKVKKLLEIIIRKKQTICKVDQYSIRPCNYSQISRIYSLFF